MMDTKVETIARLAQWRTENFGLTSVYKKSDPFKIGIWNWHLAVEKNRSVYIRLFPEPSPVSKEQPPTARFVLRVTVAGSNRRPYTSPVFDKLLCTSDDFAFPVDITSQGRLIIDVEFLDIRTYPRDGGESISIWPSEGTMRHLATRSSLKCLSRMLNESLLTDITINTADGKLQAHRAILSASSPVFHSMFLHNLKEKESSTINIEDMTSESFKALLSCIYGTMNQEDFLKHRLALLSAANKYDIADLKDACEESLLEDISPGNVLARLQEAWLYQLNKLKKGCITYLLDFGKIYDLKEDMSDFLRKADRELVVELFKEILITDW